MEDNEARWVEEDDGSYYYYYSDGTMATGWMQDGDNWYYFNDNGKMATGWQYIDGDWYYFYSTGEMATGWVNDGDGWYYLYGNGSMAWGRTVDGYYLNDDGDWVKGEGWEKEKDKDGNVIYYYDNSDGTAATGWKEIDNKWYYFDEDGKMKTGWIEDNGNWYYLNSSGEMATGRNDIGGDTYYFYSTGEMATGWIKYGDSWNYFYGDDNGSMAHDTWIGEYYVNADGEWDPTKGNNSNMGETITGWIKCSDNWYYYNLNGKMKTGWMEDDNKWYYFDPSSGVMQTGWQSIDGNEYYFDSDGHMVTDKWEEDSDGNWYYLNSDGVKQSLNYKEGDGNFLYDFALENGFSLERGKGRTWTLDKVPGLTLTAELKVTMLTNSSAIANATEDEFQVSIPNGGEIDLNTSGQLTGSASISGHGYKVQVGCSVKFLEDTVFVEASYTPSEKGGPKVDLKVSIKKEYIKLITITAIATALTLATDGMDIPALLAPLGEQAAMFVEVIESALAVASRYASKA